MVSNLGILQKYPSSLAKMKRVGCFVTTTLQHDGWMVGLHDDWISATVEKPITADPGAT
jgi:hypothetical protein